ncbi:MAG: N-6 DNA methylase [Syntrophales bacterium]|nr:N-6 DNA methylase [Syntrophales bacterium]
MDHQGLIFLRTIFVMVLYNNLSDARRHGIYYTPTHLADFLVKPLINGETISVFDPAYGEGSLLLAAENISSGNSVTRNLAFFGCDRAPVNGLLQHLPSSNLMETDFFDYFSEGKFDVIVMNPPFVRHHLIDREKIEKYQKTIEGICPIKWSSDLWAYFLVKSCLHLNTGGKVGAILPWSFLQAEYAQDIRRWLADNFEEIQLLALSAEYFNDAQERVVLLWLKGYGCHSKSINISFSDHINDSIDYFHLTKEQWQSKTVLHSNNYDITTILDNYINKHKFKKFEEFGNIKIGVVTGADNFFILDEEEASKYGFSEECLVPIFRSSLELTGLSLNGNRPSKKLIILTPQNNEKFKDYILKGVKLRYHLRAHSLRRDPWYCVNQGKVPDAFFPYRTMRIPYMVLNDQGVQCTNSIHRIYFKEELSCCEKKWIQVSMLSVPGQLSIEAYSKTYGSGVLKVEPNSLKNSVGYKSNDESINPIYDKISKLLSLNQKIDAMNIATVFIDDKLNISNELSVMAKSALIELQQRRLERYRK